MVRSGETAFVTTAMSFQMRRWLARMSDASLFSAGLKRNSYSSRLLSLNGGQGRNRTADASLFRARISCILNDLTGLGGLRKYFKGR
jgi:hypothetical protein